MRQKILAWLLGCWLPLGGSVYGQWSDNATENDTIAVTPGNQVKPAIVTDGANGAIIVWEDDRNPLSGPDIYAGRILASGTLTWTPNGQPVIIENNSQKSPEMVEHPDGGAVVTWQDDRESETLFSVYAQHIDALLGQAQWGEDSVLVQGGNNLLPGIIKDSIFGFVIASYSSFQADFLIYVQKLTKDGMLEWEPFTQPASTVRAAQPLRPPAMISDFNGGAILTWADRRDRTALLPAVYAARLNQDGLPGWELGEVLVESASSEGTAPVIIPDENGGALIAFIRPEQIGTTRDEVVVANVNAQGVLAWKTAFSGIESGRKRNVRLVRANAGTIVVIWEDLSTGPDWDIALQRLDPDGGLLGLPFEIANAPGDQVNPRTLSNGRGSVIVVWEDNRNSDTDIYAQLIEANGNTRWNANGLAVSLAPEVQKNPVLTHDGLGGTIVVWQDFRSGRDFDIYAQRVSEPGELGEFRRLTLSSPNGGEDWEIGGLQTVTWTSRGEIDSVSIELSRNGGQNYFPEDIIVRATPNTGQAEVLVTGPASSACKIRIRAVGAAFILDESDSLFTISDSAGPEISLPDTVRSAQRGQALVVSAKATDRSGIKAMTLHYRRGGASAFTSAIMTAVAPDSFVQTIPADAVTEHGVEYFVRGEDNIGIASRTNVFPVEVRFAAGVQTRRVQRGTDQTRYRMVSSPNLLDEPLADDIFQASGFGVYDTTSWRLFQFRTGINVERDSLTAQTFVFTPGEAYWLISARDRVINFGAGVSLPPGQAFTLRLEPGWNQIADPFAFSVPWDSVVAFNGNPNVTPPFFYEGAYDVTDVLQPYEGYFVFNRNSQAIDLRVPSTGVGTATKPVNPQPASGWRLQIEARCQQARDHYNYLGVHPDAASEWDPLDLPEPPPIGRYVSVVFPRPAWNPYPNRYTTEIRPRLGAGQTWTLAVETNIPHAEVRLEVRGVETLPSDVEAWLVDEALGVRRDLRREASYVLPTGPRGVTKALKMVIGPLDYLAQEVPGAQFVPDQFELAQNFPNPFNPATTIRFGLPRPASVTVRIFDLLGREVATLVEQETLPAGFHVVTWDGRDRYGRAVASGVYLYRMEAGAFREIRKMVLVR